MRSCSSGTGITRRRGTLIAVHSRPTNSFAVQQQGHDQRVRCLSCIFTGTWKQGPWITLGPASIHRRSVASVYYPRRVQACIRHTDRGQNSAVCSPSIGGGRRYPIPVRENLIGFAICGTDMPIPWSIEKTIPRLTTWGSARACATVLIDRKSVV